MRIPWLRSSRSKFVLLALAWLLWFLVGGIEITYANCADPSNPSDPNFSYAVDCNADGSPRTIRGGATSDPVAETPTATNRNTANTNANTWQAPGEGSDNVGGVQRTDPNCPGCDTETAVGRGLTSQGTNPQQTGSGGGTVTTNPQQTGSGGGTNTGGGSGGGNNTTSGGSARLANPLSNINSIPDLLAAILNVVIIIAIPIIILFIMLAGFKYVTARGNASQVQEATTALLYAVIGGVIIIGATAIAQIIKNLVNAFAAT